MHTSSGDRATFPGNTWLCFTNLAFQTFTINLCKVFITHDTCWPELVNICAIVVVKVVPGEVLMGVKTRKEPLTEASGHWEQTAVRESWRWCSGSQRLVSAKSAAVSEAQVNTITHCVGQHTNSGLNETYLPCRCHLWTPRSRTKRAAATRPKTQLSPEGMSPGPVDPGNMQGLLTCTIQQISMGDKQQHLNEVE